MNAANLQNAKRFYEFGPFRIDLTEHILFRESLPVPLTPKAFDTLLALVENPGRILEKDDLMSRVWPDTIVEENNLTQNISALRKALGQNPEERTYIETIPRRGYRFVATVRERWEEIPELIVRERTKSMVIVEEEEETDVRTSLLPALGPAKLGLLSAFAVLTVTASAYYIHTRINTADETSNGAFAGSDLRRRPSVAVLGLRNSTGSASTAWLSTALSEMLTSELAAGEQLRAIPGESISRLKLDLPFGQSDSLAPDTLARIRSNLDSDYVVVGSFTDLGAMNGSNIRLDLRLQDAQKGVIVAAFGENGTEAGLFDLVSHAGTRLREALKIGAVPQTQAAGVRAELPSNPEVAKLYSDGLGKVRAFDAIGARPLLETAVARDPQFPLAHSALGTALSALGYDAKAREEAKKAFDLSANLNREEQLVIEGRYRSVANQWDRAQEVYRTLFGLFPDNLDYGVSLVSAESMNARSDDVIATLNMLRQLPAPANLDPRIDLAEAYWAESISDFRREQQASVRAVERGSVLGAVLLVARARLAQATALWKLGQPEQALATLRDAATTLASQGDRDGEAQAALGIAEVEQDQGDLAAAHNGYEQALKSWRAAGDERGVAVSLNNLGLLRWEQADAQGARQLYNQALDAYREIGDEAGAARTLNNAADVFYSEGELETARRMYEESAAKYADVGDKSGLGENDTNIALVLANQGNLAASRGKYEQAVRIGRELGTRSLLAEALEGLGDVTLQQGDLEAAGKWYAQALSIRRELGEKGSIAETQLDLAWLALQQGRPADAQALLSPALDELRKEGESDLGAYGEAELAWALLGQGRRDEADGAAARARSLAEKAQSRSIELIVFTVDSRVDAASGDPRRITEARQSLTTVESEAGRLGFVDRQLEARLALAEMDLKGPEAASARARLAQVQKQAQQLGFVLIAQKAAKYIGQQGAN